MRRGSCGLWRGVIAVGIMLVWTVPVFALGTPQVATESVSEAVSCVVKVRSESGTGSGSSIDGRHVLTNQHVVDGSTGGQILTQDQREVPFAVLLASEELDLAILDAPGLGVGPIVWADSDRVKQGDAATVIGFPLGLERVAITRGIVSSEKQLINGQEYIQSDASANPGNSGGPLVDEEGRLIGVHTFGLRAPDGTDTEGMAFAVPSNRAKEFVTQAGIRVLEGPSAGDDPTDGEPADTPGTADGGGIEKGLSPTASVRSAPVASAGNVICVGAVLLIVAIGAGVGRQVLRELRRMM